MNLDISACQRLILPYKSIYKVTLVDNQLQKQYEREAV